MKLDRRHVRWMMASVVALTVAAVGLIAGTDVLASRHAANPLTEQIKPGAILITVKYEGRVTDTAGKSLAGVKVTLTGKTHYTATTDAKGVFRFQGVLPGTYTIGLAHPKNAYTFPSGLKLYNLFVANPSPR